MTTLNFIPQALAHNDDDGDSTSMSRIPPKVLSFDEHMRTYHKGQDYEPSSPTFFNFEAYDRPHFFRPPVWNGAANPADGLLGCQAPAAEGLHTETFTHYAPKFVQPIPQPQLATVSISLPPPIKEKPKKSLPRLPAEIHLQILKYALEPAQGTSCSFCHLFQLSALSGVSRSYHMMAQPYLYDTLNLNFNTSIDCNLSLNHKHDKRVVCEAHRRLASKHEQLEKRVPLLIRTLITRPDIASGVRKLVLPEGGTQTYLTCALEKKLLPELIRSCPNIEEVDGVDTLLSRQFFSGEHFCLDDHDTQHGVLAKTLHETKTLKKWVWNGGNAAGRDFAGRVWDFHPHMSNTDFVGAHRNWGQLEHLEIRNVWNIDLPMLETIISSLPCLRKVALVGIRKKVKGRGDASTILSTLEILPASVKEVELGNTAEESFLTAVGEWVRIRHAIKESSMLGSLRITQVPITAVTLRDFFAAISIRKSSGFRHCTTRSYLPLLDFRPRWRSVVQSLALDNTGFESMFCGVDLESSMELRGLEELEWHVRSADVDASLGGRLKRGWFTDLKTLAGIERPDPDVIAIARKRGIKMF